MFEFCMKVINWQIEAKETRETTFRFPGNDFPVPRKQLLGGNMHMDARVVKVADFKSELI